MVGRGKAADGVFRHAIQKGAAVDVAVDELIVELHGLTRNLGCLRFHG